MKYYIIAGEASGDLHGGNLITEIRKLDTDAKVSGWGGDQMEAAGATLVKHYRDLAFMGFAEVVKNLPAILRNITFCKQDISNYKPDVVILINYSAFNLRIAEWTKKNNFRNVFYISPQVWAWKESRVKSIKTFVDKMIVILPFEKQFYETWNYEVEYVGHPLVQVIDNFKAGHEDIEPSLDIVALLPGSRKQEIRKKLPIMLEATKNFPSINFILAKAPSIDDSFYESFLINYKNVAVVANETYALLMKASAAIVTSGTATLETALFGVPEIVCYKTENISYQIGKRLIKLKFISLVNLIMDREVVKELIQDKLTAENITKELIDILYDPVKREKMQFDYYLLRKQLYDGGNASAKAAKIIVESL